MKEEKIHKNTNNLIYELEDFRKILDMQQKFEKGLIKENELTEQEKENLINLYKKQIVSIKNDIRRYNTELELYKQKILAIKNKLN